MTRNARSGPRSALTPSATTLQRVDVEAGIGLVEHRELRLQQRHLQDLVALLLAAGEADIDRRASASPDRSCSACAALAHAAHELGRRQVGFAARAALRR